MQESVVVLNKEPAELCKILKFENLVMSGGEAKQVIAAGLVRVNHEVETRKRRKIYGGDQIEFQGQLFKITAGADHDSLAQTHTAHGKKAKMDTLIEFVRNLGVSEIKVISPEQIPVDDRFPGFCREPGCPGFNRSMSCPPHVKGPEWFRAKIKTYTDVLVFKYDVPSPSLLGDERMDLMALIHETAAAIETFARANGYQRARGFAGGSCKEVFCRDHLECRVLGENKPCRNPERARPSMSGMGVNFLELTRAVGWKMEVITRDTDPKAVPMGMVAGMVLVG